MSDIKTIYDPITGTFDWALDPATGGLVEETGLETAVVISLFTDRRAEPGDELPDGSDDRRGFWADSYPEVANDKIGSRLWLLARAKETPETLARAREYALEALGWMVDDRIAASVDVMAERTRAGLLGMQVNITRPDGSRIDQRFANLWRSHDAV